MDQAVLSLIENGDSVDQQPIQKEDSIQNEKLAEVTDHASKTAAHDDSRSEEKSAGNGSSVFDMTNDASSMIDAWLISAVEDKAKEPTAEQSSGGDSIVCMTAFFTAAQIVDSTSQVVQFKEKTMTAKFECGNVFGCHGRNFLFLALTHPRDNEVMKLVVLHVIDFPLLLSNSFINSLQRLSL